MAKNIQRKPFTFAAVVSPKTNLIATVHIKHVGLKVKTDSHTACKCPESEKRFQAFVV